MHPRFNSVESNEFALILPASRAGPINVNPATGEN